MYDLLFFSSEQTEAVIARLDTAGHAAVVMKGKKEGTHSGSCSGPMPAPVAEPYPPLGAG